LLEDCPAGSWALIEHVEDPCPRAKAVVASSVLLRNIAKTVVTVEERWIVDNVSNCFHFRGLVEG